VGTAFGFLPGSANALMCLRLHEHSRDPSTACPPLRHGNFAQDDSDRKASLVKMSLSSFRWINFGLYETRACCS